METKNLFTTKTFWGVALMAISFALGFFGYTFDATDQAELADKLPAFVSGIVQFVGLVLAIFGRVKASKPANILPK